MTEGRESGEERVNVHIKESSTQCTQLGSEGVSFVNTVLPARSHLQGLGRHCPVASLLTEGGYPVDLSSASSCLAWPSVT